jgi:hypothetical protein
LNGQAINSSSCSDIEVGDSKFGEFWSAIVIRRTIHTDFKILEIVRDLDVVVVSRKTPPGDLQPGGASKALTIS